MSIDIKAMGLTPKRQTFDHIARRFGEDRPASRYEEGMYDVQATDHFAYRPIWAPEYELYDASRTAIVMEDWYALRDPRQYYYGTYTIARANLNQSCERNFDFVDKRGLLDAMSEEWREKVALYLIPLRHYEWGANMNMALVSDFGYGTAITSAACFAMGDRLGIAQVLSRIGMVMDGGQDAVLEAAKANWMEHAALQPLRQLVEDTLVLQDWFESFTAQTLAMDGLVYPLVYETFDAAGNAQGGAGISMLCEFQRDWEKESRRWVDAVIKTAAAESEVNREQLSAWYAQWSGRAVEALAPLALEVLGDAAAGEALNSAKSALDQRAAKLGLSV